MCWNGKVDSVWAGLKQLRFPVTVLYKPPSGTLWIYIQIMQHTRPTLPKVAIRHMKSAAEIISI